MQLPQAERHRPLKFAAVAIDRYAYQEALDAVVARSAREPVRVFFVYANCVNIAQTHREYRNALAAAEFVLNDGAGIELAGHVLGQPVVENLCGTDWIPDLLSRLDATGKHRLFLLGATPDVVEAAATWAAQRWPRLTLVGRHHGYFDDPAPVLAAIAATAPTVLVVAMGVPRQELFLHRHWPELTAAGVRIGIAGGAVLDFMTGNVPRAPSWLRRARLEWAYRLALEPARLWRRYLLGNLKFLALLLRARLRGESG